VLPLHIPSQRGVRALDELLYVPWRSLRHAYTGTVRKNPFTGAPVRGPELDALFAGIADDEEEARRESLSDLDGCILHQGDLYPATAYAVPFVCAIATEPPPGLEGELLGALVAIGEATAYERNASHALDVLDAFRRSLPHILAIGARDGAPSVRAFLSNLGHGNPGGPVDIRELDDLA
jgi:hypothetical protein